MTLTEQVHTALGEAGPTTWKDYGTLLAKALQLCKEASDKQDSLMLVLKQLNQSELSGKGALDAFTASERLFHQFGSQVWDNVKKAQRE